jgi:hypothetical protein
MTFEPTPPPTLNSEGFYIKKIEKNAIAKRNRFKVPNAWGISTASFRFD